MALNFESAIDQLFNEIRILHDSGCAEVHLIVDGKQTKLNQIFPENHSRLSIVYTPSELTADAVLERWIARLKREWSFKVYTDDLAIRQTALSYGGEAAGSKILFEDVQRLREQTSRDVSERRKNIDKAFGTPIFSSSNERYESKQKRRRGPGGSK